MPRSWSYRTIEHIDLNASKQKGLPTAGWFIIGFAVIALTVFTTVAIKLVTHPSQVPMDQSAISAPATHK